MSASRLPKINPRILIKTTIFIGLSALVAVNLRFILSSILRTKQIDEEIVSEANPRLNKELLNLAEKIIDESSDGDLTGIFPSATVESGAVEIPAVVNIVNASGINGAAAELSQIFSSEGFEIGALSTAPSIQNQTVVFHKKSRSEAAQLIIGILEKEGYGPATGQVRENLKTDLEVVIGQ